MTATSTDLPEQPTAIYLSHGGGPLPVLGDPGHREMVAHLKDIAASIRKPSAIIVVSAHWEEPVATITAHQNPPIIYDYYGFPEKSYSIQYPAPGAPELADELRVMLEHNGVHARLDVERGFDHGLYIPLLLMYPDADIPCIQLSLLAGLDAAEHIRLGEALSGLAGAGVLVLGSGFSFHNLKAFFSKDAIAPDARNQAFEDWLFDVCTNPSLDEQERSEQLVNWDRAPAARYCHPREEHLLPLHVCYGLAKRVCSARTELTIMNKKASAYFW